MTEIVMRTKKFHHAGFVLRSVKAERVKELLDELYAEISKGFCGECADTG